MPGTARLGDMVVCVCCCHPPIPCVGTVGVFVTGSLNVVTNGRPTVRLADIAMCSCGHPTFVVGASTDVITNGRGTARLGDPVAACPVGVIVTASTDTITNG